MIASNSFWWATRESRSSERSIVSGSGSLGVFAVLGRSVEHAADRHGKPFTITGLARKLHPRVEPIVVNNGILGAMLPAAKR